MSPQDIYLETQVNTATPQRLRLMLIEAAIRLARQTVDCWRNHSDELGQQNLLRCRDVISELIAGVKGDQTPLGSKVIGLYLFLFTTLTESQATQDAARLEAAIRILEEERLTWTQVCEQLVDAPARDLWTVNDQEERAPANVRGEKFHAYGSPNGWSGASGLSLDA